MADVAPGAAVDLVLELRRSPLELPAAVAVEAGVARVAWADIGAAPGDMVHLRLVARDRAGHVVQAIPADGLERVVEVPVTAVNGRRWRA